MGDKVDRFDWVVARVAEKQHGVVALRQLIASGIRAGLPAPEVNVRVGRWTVDFLWPSDGSWWRGGGPERDLGKVIE